MVNFQPGFRLSTIDCAVLVIGALASIVLWPIAWWLGFIMAFVIGHFFAFCNVFRVARNLELAWSTIFIITLYCALSFGMPTFSVAVVVALTTTLVVIVLEMRKPSYHGILWQRINPQLPEWWSQQKASDAATGKPEP